MQLNLFELKNIINLKFLFMIEFLDGKYLLSLRVLPKHDVSPVGTKTNQPS